MSDSLPVALILFAVAGCYSSASPVQDADNPSSVAADSSPIDAAQVTSGFLGLTFDDEADRLPLVISGTVPQSHAQELGIRSGDRLVSLQQQANPDLPTIIQSLQSTRPGDLVNVVVLRENQELSFQVRLLSAQEIEAAMSP